MNSSRASARAEPVMHTIKGYRTWCSRRSDRRINCAIVPSAATARVRAPVPDIFGEVQRRQWVIAPPSRCGIAPSNSLRVFRPMSRCSPPHLQKRVDLLPMRAQMRHTAQIFGDRNRRISLHHQVHFRVRLKCIKCNYFYALRGHRSARMRRVLYEERHRHVACRARHQAAYQRGKVERIRQPPDDRPVLPAVVQLFLSFFIFFFVLTAMLHASFLTTLARH